MLTGAGSQIFILAIFSSLFILLVLGVGIALGSKGKVFLRYIFGTNPTAVESVHFLLQIGFYLLGISLLLINVGTISQTNGREYFNALQEVAARLGFSMFVVAVLHSFNLLVIAVLQRKSPEGKT